MDEKEYSYSGELPAFAPESADAIPEIARGVRNTFRVHKTKDIKYRLVQLRKFYWAMKDYQPKLLEALRRDMRKCAYEGMLSEVSYVQNDCLFASKYLEKWVKDEKLGTPDVPLHFSLMKARVRKEPLGAVLIIGTWNYPIQLLLTPFVGAIAAGCTAVLKPSEGAPTVAAVIKEMVESRLDTSAYRVVNGAVEQATALLDQKWDKIMFTGATEVGTIIAKKAAETLTPTILELGGRNPAFVTRNAPDVKLAAKRILQSKCFNAGQLCLSENYAIVQKDVLNTFIEGLQLAFKEFFPNGAQASPDLSRIINKRHFDRLKKMIDDSKGQIVVGGKMDEKELFMEPTGILVDSLDDPVVANESFGPIFGIYPYNTLDEAINAMNRIDRTPLAEAVFGNKNEIKKIVNETTSGGLTINDGWFHGQLMNAPFGGVGTSGTGNYRGRFSFEAFTHRRTVAEVPNWVEKLLRVRYMPYDWRELARLRRLSGAKPNFDRDGRIVKGLGYWVGFVLSLGGSGAKGALLRWFVLFAIGAAASYGGLLKKRVAL